MKLTPNQAFEHIKESAIEYLETAYKIDHPAIYQERGEILRQRGVVAQIPFIESTPAFPAARKLVELETLYPAQVPAGISELMEHGIPVDRFPLYTHQEEALLAAQSDKPNLLVATGTGSGKTETFLLPILTDLLREAQSWSIPKGVEVPGHFDMQRGTWIHSRTHETREAAFRGIILYPMNALVNDQLSRLRRILARGESPNWQRKLFNGNVIHFGMYTGLTQPTGVWLKKSSRERLDTYLQKVAQDWRLLRQDLRDTGTWPRPDSPEMLSRWDMQGSPPDIMVTNYSMLEYMLLRPIEARMFDQTRTWLNKNPNAKITLVLDEAHTYTGAKGTEVAYLIRRLKERLGLLSGSPQFRAIATTASVPPGGDSQLLDFVANLFGEPTSRFSLIRINSDAYKVPEHVPTNKSIAAFEQFHDQFTINDPMPAIETLATALEQQIDSSASSQVSLYQLLKGHPDVEWVRQRTARNATELDKLTDECWQNLGTQEQRDRATAGLLAAGSFARAQPLPDTPPLISMRIHAFFRGIYGIWACMDPHCSCVTVLSGISTPRPVGKLYMDPRPWCECGARVLELFSCRQCGLLFLGGIPDSIQGSLWPWTDDLSGSREDIQQFQLFGVEAPDGLAIPEYRSIRTTLHCHPQDVFARPTYKVEPATERNTERIISNFPLQCPRCHQYREPKENGREVIEPLRTKGPRAFSIIAEDGFRVQPRTTGDTSPNHGRKALLFTDSRQEAAQLAADIRHDHFNDLFRQLTLRVLLTCPTCNGNGFISQIGSFVIGQELTEETIACQTCGSTGRQKHPVPLTFDILRSRFVALQMGRKIDPTNGRVLHYFEKQATDERFAHQFFHVGLRRELSQKDFALEPLGLAWWKIRLPDSKIGNFPGMSEEETRRFLQAVTRILATENVLLPPQPLQPWEWPEEFVPNYERAVLYWGYSKKQVGTRECIPYNLQSTRKLGRYVIALAQFLVREGRIHDAEAWLQEMRKLLWTTLKGLNILSWAGAKIDDEIPYGIRIDQFELHCIQDKVQRCTSCSYVMADALFNVCLRCGQKTEQVEAVSINNFYRRAALQAAPGSSFDDPYPLRAVEHTAQITSNEARNEERWFQDLFHDHQNADDYRIDILSVTTTMEMGIDIGSLLSVGLRNVPPTVANYQQRAGRAGRRGSSLATVLTFAQFRSHDQYYFAKPPEIVSQPPRVPTLYLTNEIIARRHVRSLVLQSFFHTLLNGQQQAATNNLFNSWGTINDFATRQQSLRLRTYLSSNRAIIVDRCKNIVERTFHQDLWTWINELVTEVQSAIQKTDGRETLLDTLISTGLLPKYAFPVDVVSLNVPQGISQYQDDDDEGFKDNGMQRELAIALAEYAPGAEVIKADFPNTYIYRSVGLYDPFNPNPDYSPTGILVECVDCQSITLVQSLKDVPDRCEECNSFQIRSIPYLRPTGFTVDMGVQSQSRELYQGGGRERSGYTIPARLMVGQSAFSTGKQSSFSSHLYVKVRTGAMFTCNKGPNTDFPGFLICPVCGRSLDQDNLGTHHYPANVIPFTGKNRGPRAGSVCPNSTDYNQAVLGNQFYSEVILLGVDLPISMDAPIMFPSGKAVWYSFGVLVANAAAIVLQIDPSELKTGIRAVRRPNQRLHAEVYLYDNVPSGAGYARMIEQNLETILQKALEIGEHCENPDCGGACYHCMFDYRNQSLHAYLDRHLGVDLLRYILRSEEPFVEQRAVDRGIASVTEYLRTTWEILPGGTFGNYSFPCLLRNKDVDTVALWPIHPLQSRPEPGDGQAILGVYGMRCAVHTTFDLERRPFWVANNLVTL